jgi:hypothetical protein
MTQQPNQPPGPLIDLANMRDEVDEVEGSDRLPVAAGDALSRYNKALSQSDKHPAPPCGRGGRCSFMHIVPAAARRFRSRRGGSAAQSVAVSLGWN